MENFVGSNLLGTARPDNAGDASKYLLSTSKELSGIEKRKQKVEKVTLIDFSRHSLNLSGIYSFY